MRNQIEKMSVRAFRVPTDAPESDGTLRWDSTTIVLVQLRSEGRTGFGYTYSDAALVSLIRNTFQEHVIGEDPLSIPEIDTKLKRASRNLGTGGLIMHAISAVNFALWDLKAQLLEVSMVDLLGAARNGIPIYGSGGFTSYSIDRLQEQLGGWVEQGIPRVKMKVGRDPAADLSRVQAAREAIGPDAELFVDANGAYSRKQALSQANEFAQLDVCWFEEPVSSDNLEGLRLIRDQGPPGMEITAGEYGDRPVYFQRMLNAQAVDVLMADGTRCGGITGFIQAAELCRGFQIPLSAHTAPNLHAQVCTALEQVRHVEYFHDHVRIEQMFFDGALQPKDGELCPDRSRPGFGLVLKESDVRQFEIT